MHHPTERIDNTYHSLCYTSRGALAGTNNAKEARGKQTGHSILQHPQASESGTAHNHQAQTMTMMVKYETRLHISRERDVAQSIACPPLKRSVVGSILLSGPSCSLGYFPFQPVVHNWFIKGRGMYCSVVYGKVHIKDPLLLIEKSSLCGGSGFTSKKCVNVTI